MSTSKIATDEYVEDKKVRTKKIRRVDVEWEGSRMVLPVGMDYTEAIKALKKRQEQDEQTVKFSSVIKAFPSDGAVALQKALRQKYGWVNLEPKQSWWGPEKPELIPVDISYDEAIQVPWGNFTVPNISGRLSTDWENHDGLPQFVIRASIRRADQKIFEEIVDLTKQIVSQDSIYKGQAIKLSFRDDDGDLVTFSPEFCPKFMDLKAFDPTELVLPQDAADGIQINLWNPIVHSDFCRLNKMPLKRGVLLEGGFGTGKTLTAFQTAQLCVDNGWTFILLDDVRDIHQALSFARFYEPCVIFAEDVDKAVSGSRTNEVNRIFNTIDGIESKGHEIMTVLTTNLVGNINPGFIRPGRIDAVITVGPPDDQAIVRLVRRYCQDRNRNPMVDESVTDEEIVEAMAPVKGANAAFIREVVERSKLAAISHCDGAIAIKAEDLSKAAKSMISHLNLVDPSRAQAKEEENVMESAIEEITARFADSFVDCLVDPSSLKRLSRKAQKSIK